ncbi:MAG: hypothetical protein J07HX5_01368 [halophilic archaeon J07HX5]|nr:MAG: hypothetical protein J07HX5_01368 [halophilic archaeon J07HX5]
MFTNERICLACVIELFYLHESVGNPSYMDAEKFACEVRSSQF